LHLFDIIVTSIHTELSLATSLTDDNPSSLSRSPGLDENGNKQTTNFAAYEGPFQNWLTFLSAKRNFIQQKLYQLIETSHHPPSVSPT
jgi:hypothetical protein